MMDARAAAKLMDKLAGDLLWAVIAATPDDAPPCDGRTWKPLDPQSSHADCLVYLNSYREWVRRRREAIDKVCRELWDAARAFNVERGADDGEEGQGERDQGGADGSEAAEAPAAD